MNSKDDIKKYYSTGIEHDRLLKGSFQLEYARTQEIILRYITRKPLKILDVGGGTGMYSFWLSEQGHEVHMIDPVPVNIEKAQGEASHLSHPPASISVGEAAKLHFENEYFDIVLLFGPLYHLTERGDRLHALAEGKRVLKNGGMLFAAAISRYASTIDGFVWDFVQDPEFQKIMKQDLSDGQHRNHTDNPLYFTTAFFHHPNELKQEIVDAGLEVLSILPLESVGSMIPDFERKWADDAFRTMLLNCIRSIEHDESIAGITSHMLAVCRK